MISKKSSKLSSERRDLEYSVFHLNKRLSSSHIQGRVHISDELKQRKLGDEATKGQELIRHVHKVRDRSVLLFPLLIQGMQDLVDTLSTMRSDVHQTRDLKAKVDQTVQDTIVATRIIDGFRNPQQYGVYLKNYATFPLECVPIYASPVNSDSAFFCVKVLHSGNTANARAPELV